MVDFNEKIQARKSFICDNSRQKDFFKELWVIKKNEKFPEFKPIDFDLSNINKKYLYAQTCLDCEPSIPQLSKDRMNLAFYRKALERNKNYSALIVIEDGTMFDFIGRAVSSKRYAGIMRKSFTGGGRIENKRVKIIFIKNTKDEIATVAYFYIVPKMNNRKK